MLEQHPRRRGAAFCKEPTIKGAALFAMLIVTTALSAGAQGRGGGMGRPGMSGGGMSHGPFGGGASMPNAHGAPTTSGGGGKSPESTTHSALQLGPTGRWWDDKDFARSVGIDSAQQHRMDDVFNANKGNLVSLYKNLQHEESELGRLVRGKELVESQIFEQIDRVTQARGELEKASAHYLLQIRKEMTPEQASRLDDHRPSQ